MEYSFIFLQDYMQERKFKHLCFKKKERRGRNSYQRSSIQEISCVFCCFLTPILSLHNNDEFWHRLMLQVCLRTSIKLFVCCCLVVVTWHSSWKPGILHLQQFLLGANLSRVSFSMSTDTKSFAIMLNSTLNRETICSAWNFAGRISGIPITK